jgi:hypothetical protein
MNIHKNARLTPSGRERIVRKIASGERPAAIAEAAGVCQRTRARSSRPWQFAGVSRHLSAGHNEAQRPTFAVDNRVDLYGSAAPADADRLIFPLFSSARHGRAAKSPQPFAWFTTKGC